MLTTDRGAQIDVLVEALRSNLRDWTNITGMRHGTVEIERSNAVWVGDKGWRMVIWLMLSIVQRQRMAAMRAKQVC